MALHLKSTGIDFTDFSGAGGATSELLDDYEEGKWTPTYNGVDAVGTKTYNQQQGLYNKIGRHARLWLDITVATASGMNGLPAISACPFQSSATSDMFTSSWWSVDNNFTGSKTTTGWITTNAAWFYLYTHAGDTNAGHAGMAINTTGRIAGSIIYSTA